MPTINRDRDIVRHILRYCEQVDTAHKDFGHSKERFEANTTYQNAVSMCILQIGELINRLSMSTAPLILKSFGMCQPTA